MGEKNSTIQYEELSRCTISPTHSVVVSKCSQGGFTVAQQKDMIRDGEREKVFLKGAFHVADYDAMVRLSDAIFKASQKSLDSKENIDDEDAIDWDDVIDD